LQFSTSRSSEIELANISTTTTATTAAATATTATGGSTATIGAERSAVQAESDADTAAVASADVKPSISQCNSGSNNSACL
jgi:hypothetical protein